METQNNNVEIEVSEIVPQSTALYSANKAQIDVQVSTARAYPRNVMKATDNAVALVSMDRGVAATCTYSIPRGGKSISGPSVHLARILMSCWGNIRAEARVIDVSDKHVTSEAICWDLENNSAIKVEVKRSIMTRNGRMSDDMITVTGNAANSIALRNAIFSVLPQGVTNKVYKSALKTITGDISTEDKLIAKRKKVVEQFMGDFDVSEDQVLALVGKSALSHLTPENITTLVGVWQAIKDGDTSVEETFSGVRTGKPDAAKVSDDKQLARLKAKLDSAKDPDELDLLLATVAENEAMAEMVQARINELKQKN